MSVNVVCGPELLAAGANDHPDGKGDDNEPGSNLEVGFGALRVPGLAKLERKRGQDPDDGGVRNGRGNAQQHRLGNRASDGNDERRHHGLGMTRLQAVQSAEQQGARHENPRAARTLLNQIRKRGHVARALLQPVLPAPPSDPNPAIMFRSPLMISHSLKLLWRTCLPRSTHPTPAAGPVSKTSSSTSHR